MSGTGPIVFSHLRKTKVEEKGVRVHLKERLSGYTCRHGQSFGRTLSVGRRFETGLNCVDRGILDCEFTGGVPGGFQLKSRYHSTESERRVRRYCLREIGENLSFTTPPNLSTVYTQRWE